LIPKNSAPLQLESFFVRHTSKLDIIDTALDNLFDTDTIAIHFPERRLHLEGDFESLDPNKYGEVAARLSMKTLNILSDHGGYIWAQYRQLRKGRYADTVRIKVGKILPQSIALYRTRWRTRDRDAVLKTLRMTSVRQIWPGEENTLRKVRPREGTIRRWPAARNQLGLLVEGKRNVS